MGDLNNRPTIDEVAGALWEKSADRVFAIAPVARLPTDGRAARYSHLLIASADVTEVHFHQIPLDGFDHDQARKCLAASLKARGSCVIRNSDNEAELAEFCAATWAEQWASREADTALAEKFSNRKKQIEEFVSERTKEALASSKIMSSDWRETLDTLGDHFVSDMNNLDVSATINQAKVCALGLIEYAFLMGGLIGRSMSDAEAGKIWAAAKSVAAAKARAGKRARQEKFAEAVKAEAATIHQEPAKSAKFVQAIAPGLKKRLGLVSEPGKDRIFAAVDLLRAAKRKGGN